MTIIDQLEKALTPALLGDDLDQKDNIAAVRVLRSADCSSSISRYL